uniref:SH2 domain-containing protein n=1 Tax=Sinocyclocheilus grahami TaxID=75366 RepID=A0A672K1U1_SINGR
IASYDPFNYHGRISRRQAEEILNEAGRDGSYLIRDSAITLLHLAVVLIWWVIVTKNVLLSGLIVV